MQVHLHIHTHYAPAGAAGLCLLNLCAALAKYLRTKRFYTTKDLVTLYKSHVLPVLEFPTPAFFHASTTVLQLLDNVQDRFLQEVGLSEEEALVNYNLAPLRSRRDIAALGLIHRTVLGKGPAHFQKWFFLDTTVPAYNTRLQERKHSKHLYEHARGSHTEFLKRSLLGQVRVYNRLPQDTVNAGSVKKFQKKLQDELKQQALLQDFSGLRGPWRNHYSVRNK